LIKREKRPKKMFFPFVSDFKITTLAIINLTTDIMSNFPLLKFHFIVEWGGERIGFSEVTGLDLESEVIEYRDGAQADYTSMKVPGLKKYSNITFKRGTFQGDFDFFQWYKTIYNGDYKRDITIILLGKEHEPIITWRVKNAWPKKILSTDLRADANEIAIETMEVVHEGLTIQH
jgi:phage tail-like protein